MTEATDSSQPSPLRPCPVCSAPLARSSQVGVSIDVCEEHGVWLDRGELRKIIEREWARFESGQVEVKGQSLEQARRQKSVDGYFWGLLSALGSL